MDGKSRFYKPRRDDQLPAEANIWRKGLVYTRRLTLPGQRPIASGYQVLAAFKCGRAAAGARAGFRGLYRRVRSLAQQAISEKRCPDTGKIPVNRTLCHGWGSFGEANISIAFLNLELRCPPLDCDEQVIEVEPTEQDFLEPGGSSLEELARINPQRVDESYNEFDFTEVDTCNFDLVTLSYGETASISTQPDFAPFVRRAEKQAERYHAFLRNQGEMRSDDFRIIHRQWFLASSDFVTVHVCFER